MSLAHKDDISLWQAEKKHRAKHSKDKNVDIHQYQCRFSQCKLNVWSRSRLSTHYKNYPTHKPSKKKPARRGKKTFKRVEPPPPPNDTRLINQMTKLGGNSAAQIAQPHVVDQVSDHIVDRTGADQVSHTRRLQPVSKEISRLKVDNIIAIDPKTEQERRAYGCYYVGRIT